MKKTIVCLLLSACFLSAGAQEKKNDCCKDFSELDSVAKIGYSRKECHRDRNYLFARQTLLYAPLSYMSGPWMELGVPKGHYIISADVVPQFVIGGKWWPFPIHITPRFMVRILPDNKKEGDSSLPVRTPSYIPGATIYFPFNACDAIASTSYLNYGSLSVFHHSNGQDGDEFTSGGRELNHYNGNFSTNFFELAYSFRVRSNFKPVFLCRATGSRFHEIYGRIGYERHFGTADSLKSSYGDTRWNLRLGWFQVKGHRDLINCAPVDEAYHRETVRIVFNATYIASKRILNLDKLERRLNMDLNLYRRIPGSPNAAGFIGVGYYGSDPYNIYYDTKPYFFVRAGIAAGFFFSPLKSEPRD
jgi:hypothetical protein